MHMLIRNARVWPADPPVSDVRITDVRITDGRVTECAPGLRPAPGEADIDAAGNALLPGLHDHHIHLWALAAAQGSVAVGPPAVRTAAELRDRLRAADASLPAGGWLRCVGYHESVAGPLDRLALDRMLAHRPVRVQHRTGALWMLNSVAVARLGLDPCDLDSCDLDGVERDGAGRPTGRLWRLDRWLAARVPRQPPDLAAVSASAAARGVTGFTDATPDLTDADIAALAAARADGTVGQRVYCMAPAGLCPPPDGGVRLGPVKIMLDDDTLPPLQELAARMRAAHAVGRPVAVHCVTRVQLVLTLAALNAAGRRHGDRIEHGAVIPAETIPDLRGLTIVSQPHFVAERGEQYATDVAREDLPDLWRLGSLITAGAAVAAGSDAPFGGADPWPVIRAATRRPANLGPAEAIAPAAALGLFLGEPTAPATPRRIAPGSPADLVLLRCPPEEAARSLASDLVAATFVDGRLAYARNALRDPGWVSRTADSGEDEGDVVFVPFAERGDEFLAGGVQALVLLGQRRPEREYALVERAGTGLYEAVGIQREGGARPELDVGLTVAGRSHSKRLAVGQIGDSRAAVGQGKYGRKVTGGRDGAGLAVGVDDGVGAGDERGLG
jgi:predicted amidohydrolase YtcJ